MKKKVCRFARTATPVVVMAVFLAAIFFTWTNLSIAAPAASGTPAKTAPAVSGTPAKAAPTDSGAPPRVRRSQVQRTEARIADLQKALKITPDQQGVWNALVQVMKDNAKEMDELRKARTKSRRDMNAVEDLQNYCQVTETHLAGMKKMLPAFEALYNSMSDEQKKNADALFKMGRHEKQGKQKSK